MEKHSNTLVIYSAFTAAVSSFIFGFNIVMPGIITDVYNEKETLPRVFMLFCPAALFSTLVSSSVPFTPVHSIMFINVFYLIGFLLFAVAPKKWYFYASRIMSGIGIGLNCAYIPAYLGKVAFEGYIAMFCSLHQLFLIFGILASYVAAWLFHSKKNWRIPIVTAAIFTIVHTFMLLFVIDVTFAVDKSAKSIIALFSNKSLYKSIATAVVLHTAQQLSGINAIIVNLGDILSKEPNPRLYNVYVGVFNSVATLISSCIINLTDRRVFLSSSMVLAGVSNVFFYLDKFPFVGSIIFLCGFSLGLGPIVWMISYELFDDNYLNSGITVANTVNWLLAFIIPIFHAWISKIIGRKSYLIYVVSMGLGLFYVLVAMGDTRKST